MCRTDAGSQQDCYAFATAYNHITTPMMVVQVITNESTKFSHPPWGANINADSIRP